MQDWLIPLKIRWLVLICLVGLVFGLPLQPIDTSAVSAFQQATAAIQGLGLNDPGRPPQSNALPESEKPTPPGSKARSNRQTAEQIYRQVIARRPRDPQPWQQLGHLYVNWGRPDDALYAYGQAVERSDLTASLLRDLAELYTILGNHRQAMHHWVEYIARRPNDPSDRLILAQTAIRLADWERAHSELERLLDDDPENLLAHAWMGLLLVGPDPLAARPHLQRAAKDPALAAWVQPVLNAERQATLSNDPAYRSALLGVAFLDLDVSTQQQHRDLAAVTARLAQRSLLSATYRNPAYAQAYAYLGHSFDKLGHPGWGQASLQHALHLDPQSPVVLTLIGLYWDRRGDSALARHYYQVAYKYDPDNAALCLEIAATYADEGNYTATEVWLLFAAELAPENPQVWEVLTRYYLESGIDAERSGMSAANRLLELSTDDALAHDLVGWAYFLAAQEAQAEASLLQALDLDPTLASAHYHLGRLRAHQSRYAEAVQSYRQAADYDLDGQLETVLERAWEELPARYQGGS